MERTELEIARADAARLAAALSHFVRTAGDAWDSKPGEDFRVGAYLVAAREALALHEAHVG